MEAEHQPEPADPPMMRIDELDRLLALELACDCLLAHTERLERLAEVATDLRAA